jgi:hypothetical protein
MSGAEPCTGDLDEQGFQLARREESGDVVVGVETLARLLQAGSHLGRDRQIVVFAGGHR